MLKFKRFINNVNNKLKYLFILFCKLNMSKAVRMLLLIFQSCLFTWNICELSEITKHSFTVSAPLVFQKMIMEDCICREFYSRSSWKTVRINRSIFRISFFKYYLWYCIHTPRVTCKFLSNTHYNLFALKIIIIKTFERNNLQLRDTCLSTYLKLLQF